MHAADVQAFLLRFRPINALMSNNPAWENADPKAVQEARKSLEQISEMLHKYRYELESLFRHFDSNGDGACGLLAHLFAGS